MALFPFAFVFGEGRLWKMLILKHFINSLSFADSEAMSQTVAVGLKRLGYRGLRLPSVAAPATLGYEQFQSGQSYRPE
jgi:hypothetical protein